VSYFNGCNLEVIFTPQLVVYYATHKTAKHISCQTFKTISIQCHTDCLLCFILAHKKVRTRVPTLHTFETDVIFSYHKAAVPVQQVMAFQFSDHAVTFVSSASFTY
jgi:hypothetical protein